MKTLTKKKHFLLLGAGMLSLAVAGSVGAITASAASISQDGGTGTTTVKYEVAETWTVTTPAELTVGGEAGQITATGSLFEGNTLEVTVTSAGSWKVGGVGYKLTCDSTEVKTNDGKICEFAAADLLRTKDSGGVTKNVKAELDGDADGYAHSSASDTITWNIASKSAD